MKLYFGYVIKLIFTTAAVAAPNPALTSGPAAYHYHYHMKLSRLEGRLCDFEHGTDATTNCVASFFVAAASCSNFMEIVMSFTVKVDSCG